MKTELLLTIVRSSIGPGLVLSDKLSAVTG